MINFVVLSACKHLLSFSVFLLHRCYYFHHILLRSCVFGYLALDFLFVCAILFLLSHVHFIAWTNT